MADLIYSAIAALERTRIEREFDADAIRQLKASAVRDLAIDERRFGNGVVYLRYSPRRSTPGPRTITIGS